MGPRLDHIVTRAFKQRTSKKYVRHADVLYDLKSKKLLKIFVSIAKTRKKKVYQRDSKEQGTDSKKSKTFESAIKSPFLKQDF